MSEDKLRAGIHDPWRVGGDVGAPPDASAKKKRRDPDQDLAPATFYVLRQGGAAIKVHGANNSTEATAAIVNAVSNNIKLRKVLEIEGIYLSSRENSVGFGLYAGDRALHCPQAYDVTDGFQRLNKALRVAVRTGPDLKRYLQQCGVLPLVS